MPKSISLPNALSDPRELAAFARVRLIAFDLDGTLIAGQAGKLGPRLSKLFTTLAHAPSSVTVTLATGRTLAGATAALGAIAESSRVPLVLYNGSVVIQPEKHAILFHRSIDRSTVDQLLQACASVNGASAFVYTISVEPSLIGDRTKTEAVYFFGPESLRPLKDFNGMEVLDSSDFASQQSSVVAVLLSAPTSVASKYLGNMASRYAALSATTSGSGYVEIRPAKSSKVDGISWLANHFELSRDQVLAVGDNDNDVELLSWSGLSVSVSGSSTAAQAASKYHSDYGAGNAAIEVLEIVKRAQRLFKEEKWHGTKTLLTRRPNWKP